MRTASNILSIIITCVLIGLAVALLFVQCAHAEDREVRDVAKAILYLDPDLDMLYVDTLASLIEHDFEENGGDPVFGVVLCYMESRFNPKATGPDIKWSGRVVNCIGLFQIHPCHGEQCSYDIEVNVEAGAEIWGRYLDRKDGDRYEALKRYGHGSRTARKTLALYEEVCDALVH